MKFETFRLGQVFVTDRHIISKEDAIIFAERYDPQSVYLRSEESRVPISPLYVLSEAWGLWIRADIFGEDQVGGVGMNDVRILAPVFSGIRIYTEGIVQHMRPSASRTAIGILTMHFQIKNEHDQPVITWEDISFMTRI